jgi:subtilisin-like proprotein convertase family protein
MVSPPQPEGDFVKLSTCALALLSFGASAALVACGPSPAGNGGGDDNGNGDDSGGGPDANDNNPGGGGGCAATPGPENTPAACSDGVDNECDGKTDCSDPDCSGIGQCPVCGQVQQPTGGGIMLPDGVNDDIACTGSSGAHDSSCAATTPYCVESTCRQSYGDTLNFVGFDSSLTYQHSTDIQSVCVNMEHSWVRDLEISLVAPDGKQVILSKFMGRTPVTEYYLGTANDCDEGNPQPGTGATYCFTPTATNPTLISYANAGTHMTSVTNCDGLTSESIPAGNYSAADPWTNLVGAPLDGNWQIVVTDLWHEDNGFIFNWSISFDPNLVSDCSGPIIGFGQTQPASTPAS